MPLNKFFKGQDLFGHLISFNFNENGDTHNTQIGGIFSILIKLGFSIYIFLNIKKCILYEDDKVVEVRDATDLD